MMKKVLGLGLLCLAVVFACAGATRAQTFAERLGWGPNDRVLIIHSDDVGMCHETTLGAIDGLERGIVSSISMMMPCPWVGEIAAYVKAHPNVDAGLHLAMNSEWDYYRWGPVAGKSAVPGLADQWGCLWDNTELLVQHASADEVETEIRAQIDRAAAFGITPTHIDTHMGGLFATPEFAMRYIKVAIEKQIPMMMFNLAPEQLAEEAPELADQLPAVIQMVWDAGLPILDHLITNNYDWPAEERKARYIEALGTLKPGVTEMIVHCAKRSDNFMNITGAADRWIADGECMIDPEIKQVLEEEHIILTTWREVMARRKALP